MLESKRRSDEPEEEEFERLSRRYEEADELADVDEAAVEPATVGRPLVGSGGEERSMACRERGGKEREGRARRER